MERYLNGNKCWLEVADIKFKISIYKPCPFSSSGGSHPQGPPNKNFRTKKPRVEDLVKSRSAAELNTAAEVSNSLLGHRNLL